MCTVDNIFDFIDRFTYNGAHREVITTFTCGCCYWFAFILFTRFKQNNPEIMYDQVANHFGTRIKGRVYDITGDVTSQYKWEPWNDLEDEALKQRLIKYCINLE